MFDAGRSGPPRTSKENIEHVKQAFYHSPMKSISCLTIGTSSFNSAQSPTQEFKIVCLQSANVTGSSAKRHAKMKRICSEHAAMNF